MVQAFNSKALFDAFVLLNFYFLHCHVENTFIIVCPSPPGVSQTSSQSSGPLAFVTTAGNLRRLSLNTDNETGLWQLSVSSNNPYLVKVTGQYYGSLFLGSELHEMF